MVSALSALKPTQRRRVVFSASQDVFEKRLFPSRTIVSKTINRNHVTSSKSSEYLAWAFLKPQKTIARSRTICDFSAHIKYCQDEDDYSDRLNFTNSKSIQLNGTLENEWSIPRSLTMNDFSSQRNYTFDDDTSAIDDQFTEKLDKMSFVEESFKRFSTNQDDTQNNLRIVQNFLYLDDLILTNDQLTADDPLMI